MALVRKCVVWDLDNTLWDGVCLEGAVRVRPGVCHVIEELDRRGILHSIASRGEKDIAFEILRDHNLDNLFLAPQINWEPKPKNIITISKELNIALDAIAFVDDDRFELNQVTYMLPEVLTIEASRASELTLLPDFCPECVTREARARRQFYQAEQARKCAESRYRTREGFLASCAMRLTLRSMVESDLPRASELMSRTHQLNTTGRVLPQEELLKILNGASGTTTAKVAELTDCYGSYGIVGVAILKTTSASWTLQYLAVSCRVLGRGVERAILASLLHHGHNLGLSCAKALFRDTGRNRAMRALYQMMGFRKQGVPTEDGTTVFLSNGNNIPEVPSWIEVL